MSSINKKDITLNVASVVSGALPLGVTAPTNFAVLGVGQNGDGIDISNTISGHIHIKYTYGTALPAAPVPPSLKFYALYSYDGINYDSANSIRNNLLGTVITGVVASYTGVIDAINGQVTASIPLDQTKLQAKYMRIMVVNDCTTASATITLNEVVVSLRDMY